MTLLRGTLLHILMGAASMGVASPVLGQTAQPAELAAVRQAIDSGNTAYKAAFQHADAEALARVYDPQGARLNEGGAVVRGRAAIAGDVARFLAEAGPVRVGIETAEVWLVDDTAYETGVWSYAFRPKGKTEQRIGGRYVTLWKRQADGSWRISADMGVPGT
jgi:uncharacterized protein (TIGR02246 family)